MSAYLYRFFWMKVFLVFPQILESEILLAILRLTKIILCINKIFYKLLFLRVLVIQNKILQLISYVQAIILTNLRMRTNKRHDNFNLEFFETFLRLNGFRRIRLTQNRILGLFKFFYFLNLNHYVSMHKDFFCDVTVIIFRR